MKTLVSLLILLCPCFLFSQVKIPDLPKVKTPIVVSTARFKTNTTSTSSRIKKFEQDKQTLTTKQNRANNILNDAFETHVNSFSYELPSNINKSGALYYQLAYGELKAMMNGHRKMDLKRAVYLVENAWFGNQISYESFEKKIQEDVNFCYNKLKEEGLADNEIAKQWVLHQFISDTLKVKDPLSERERVHTPFSYDFDDYRGKEDWSKMFVTKLLHTKSGQCHSLPLLYLIYAQELGIKNAHLAFSPSHSYVKIKDEQNNWHNLELTNGHFMTDARITESGFVKVEAIKNKIYMEPLSLKQTIGECLVDLAQGYYKKFGFDDFVLKCVKQTLIHHPNNINAIMVKSDYYTTLFSYVIKQIRCPPNVLPRYRKAYELLLQRNAIYQQIDNLGYEQMPEEQYQAWLKSLDKEKKIRAAKPKITPINEY